MGNNRWHRDLELEIKNTGEKPIYYISLIIKFPEIRLDDKPVSVHLRYGQHSLFDGSKGRAQPEDISLRPKDTLILVLDETAKLAWEQWQAKEKWAQPKKVVIAFEELTFGDGTGFFGGNGAPWPFPRQKQSKGVINSSTLNANVKSHHGILKKPKNLGIILIGGESADLRSTNFCYEGSALAFANAPNEDSLEPANCCPNNCQYVTVLTANYCFNCNRALPRANGVACLYEFEGICASVYSNQELCTDGIYCPYDDAYPCGYVPPSPTPTPTPTPTPDEPTPTPTPEPTPTAPPCNPAEKPNNTNCFCDNLPYIMFGAPPRWTCPCNGGMGADYHQFPGAQGYAGCPQNKYNNGQDCCICQTQTCPDGSQANSITCECPSPSPTPTATQQTGSGGGGSGGDGQFGGCTEYYWYWFVSADGGRTWRYTGSREYAGCW